MIVLHLNSLASVEGNDKGISAAFHCNTTASCSSSMVPCNILQYSSKLSLQKDHTSMIFHEPSLM